MPANPCLAEVRHVDRRFRQVPTREVPAAEVRGSIAPSMRRTDDLEEVGSFASYSCQMNSLHLRPWQTAPLWVGNLDVALHLPFGDPRGDREAAELLKKMLDAGLSRFEPDPLDALDHAEAARAAAT